MSKPKVTVAGFVTTDSYLNVHFTASVGTSVRYLEAKVRMSDLAHDVEFGAAYERAMVRLFKSRWEPDIPLLFDADGLEDPAPPWTVAASDDAEQDTGQHRQK